MDKRYWTGVLTGATVSGSRTALLVRTGVPDGRRHFKKKAVSAPRTGTWERGWCGNQMHAALPSALASYDRIVLCAATALEAKGMQGEITLGDVTDAV